MIARNCCCRFPSPGRELVPVFTAIPKISGYPKWTRRRSVYAEGAAHAFKPAETDEEWLQLDAKVNDYPGRRTFKAIGTADAGFADLMVGAVQSATEEPVDRAVQVLIRPSRDGSYLAVSVRQVRVRSGEQVLLVYRSMREAGGKQLKYLI